MRFHYYAYLRIFYVILRHIWLALVQGKGSLIQRMKRRKAKRVAIALEMEWGYKRHLETYAGCQRYADEAGWDCFITPTTPKLLRMENGKPSFDGILARATPALAIHSQTNEGALG